MSIVDLSALNPHCASGYTFSHSICHLFNITRAKASPMILRGYSTVVVTIAVVSLVLVERDNVGVANSLGTVPSS